MVNSVEVSSVVKHYFNPSGDQKVLASYVQKGLDALKNGEVCVQVEAEDVEELLNSNQVSNTPEDLTKPFILTGNKFYFQRYLSYENQVLFKIKDLIKSGKEKAEGRLEELRGHSSLINQLFGGFEKLDGLS